MLGIAAPLLDWFAAHRRILPFREDPTPYHIWISEIMLQQTRMQTVLPYYMRFMEAYPTPAALAAADPAALHKIWEGLGYYSRADNLRRAAGIIAAQYGGEMPRSWDELRALPGIGDYTAGAIASISCQIPVPAVDGNVLRVFARLYNDGADVAAASVKRRFTERVREELPHDRPGDFNQALMELGALVCVPGRPQCGDCPLADRCLAAAAGTAASLPAKKEKKPRRAVRVTVLVVHSPAGVLLQRRPASGLLAGLWQPLTWEEPLEAAEVAARLCALVPGARLGEALPAARHVFTHLEWTLGGYFARAEAAPPLPENMVWAAPEALTAYAIPSAFAAYRAFLSETE